jgi:hypothetical protein
MYNNYENGGLKVPHVQSFCYSLKITWIKQLLDDLKFDDWKLLFNTGMEKYGGNIIWLAKESNPSFLKKLNPFWKDVYILYRAALIVSGCIHGTNKNNVLNCLGWMTLADRRKEKNSLLMYDRVRETHFPFTFSSQLTNNHIQNVKPPPPTSIQNTAIVTGNIELGIKIFWIPPHIQNICIGCEKHSHQLNSI